MHKLLEAPAVAGCLGGANEDSGEPARSRADEVRTFVDLLFEPGDLAEIRCIGGVGGTWRDWRPASDFASAAVLERLARANESGANIYIGINPRKRKGGAAEDVALARAVWVDLDGGVTPEEARRRVREANLPEPSLMVRSGNGVHVYWRLETPHADLGDWSARMKGLIAAVGGDPVIHDPPRIMRLPGFENTKREVRVRCEVVEAWPDRRYAPEAFALPAAPRAAPAAARVSRPPTGVQRVGQSTLNFVRFGAAYGERNSSLFKAACDLAGCGLAIETTETLLGPVALACGLGAEEISRTIQSAFSRDRAPVASPAEPEVEFITGDRLVREYRSLREPVVEGLLRAGEVMNVVAAPKVGKSWLVHGLALSAASGTRWLGREVRQAPVLLIDAELHHETLAHRLEQVANHSEAGLDALAGVEVWPLRGKRADIDWVHRRIAEREGPRLGLIIVDALYRFMPVDCEENSNEAMTRVYNVLDAIAEGSGASVVVVHHTSKGDQSSKSVTDIGSGAGAQSRAADTHLVLRHHEEEGAVVVDAAVRSWKPAQPYVIRWSDPGWRLAPDLDPTALRKPPRRPKAASGADQGRSAPVDWTPAMFAADVVGPVPRIKDDICARAKQKGLSRTQAESLLKRALEERLVHRHVVQNEPHRFSTSTLAGAPLRNVWERDEGGGGGGVVPPSPPVLFAPGGVGGTPTPPSPPPIPPEHGAQWGRL